MSDEIGKMDAKRFEEILFSFIESGFEKIPVDTFFEALAPLDEKEQEEVIEIVTTGKLEGTSMIFKRHLTTLAVLYLLIPCSLSVWGASLDVDLNKVFEDAGKEFGVPADLLKVVGYVQSRWGQRDGERAAIEGGVNRYGIMQLIESDTELAAQLLNVPIWKVKTDPIFNIRGAAAVLNQYAEGVPYEEKEKLEAWRNALLKFSGILDPALAEYYVSLIYRHLNEGIHQVLPDGIEIQIDVSSVPRYLFAPQQLFAAADYPGARWDPADPLNQTPGREGVAIKSIVLHTMGTMNDGIAWFKNSAAQASAHYLISMQGEVIQMVREQDTAWHATNYNVNLTSIGIEHEAPQTGWDTEALYAASLALIRYLCNQYGIPQDERHILRHGEVHDGKTLDGRTLEETGLRTDPPQWFYDEIMRRLPKTSYTPTFKGGQRVKTNAAAWIRIIPGTKIAGTTLTPQPLSSGTEGIILNRQSNGRDINGKYVTDHYWWYWEVNGKQGWTAEDLLEPVLVVNTPPNPPTAINQFKSDGVVAISEGGTTNESTVIFKGMVFDLDNDQVKLQIELRQITEAFTNTPTLESSLVGSGIQVTITRGGLVNASYKWRYRAMDAKSLAGSWVEFGTAGNTDFVVNVPQSVVKEPLNTIFVDNTGAFGILEGSFSILPTDEEGLTAKLEVSYH